MSMELRLFNTLTGEVEVLAPPELRFYACGPTVYNRAHVGNFRTLVAVDVLRRTLRHFGYRVREVMNITDVDDRIIEKAQQAGKDLRAFTAEYIQLFEQDMAALRLERPEFMPRATDHIAQMIELIGRLRERGHTYDADGSVYFRIASFPEYGRLSHLDVAGIQDGARVDTDKYEKENARDFVLWKLKSDEPAWAQWDAPFGKGRPGWHIECSAMSMKYLGETFDLHAGGEDLIFPHHENEIAQSQCGTGKLFARHWMHVKHLLIDNETMSKSKGNFFTIKDLIDRGQRPEAIRYLLAGSHYRKPLNFSFEGVDQAAAALERIHGLVVRLDELSVAAAGASEAAVEDAESVCRECRAGVRRGAGGRSQHSRGARRGPRARQPHELPDRRREADAVGGRACPRRAGGDGRCLRCLPALGGGGPAVAGGAGAARRAAGGAAQARLRARRRRPCRARGARRGRRGHAQGPALAAEAIAP